jgi:hypothetical protein
VASKDKIDLRRHERAFKKMWTGRVVDKKSSTSLSAHNLITLAKALHSNDTDEEVDVEF